MSTIGAMLRAEGPPRGVRPARGGDREAIPGGIS